MALKESNYLYPPPPLKMYKSKVSAHILVAYILKLPQSHDWKKFYCKKNYLYFDLSPPLLNYCVEMPHAKYEGYGLNNAQVINNGENCRFTRLSANVTLFTFLRVINKSIVI